MSVVRSRSCPAYEGREEQPRFQGNRLRVSRRIDRDVGRVSMSPTKVRDMAMRLAREDAVAALRLARGIPDPWFRAQALAAVARWIDDAQVERVAEESLTCAATCHDDYQRSAVAAWAIRALLERGHPNCAAEALAAARQRALAASPAGSRAEALFGLLQAAWDLGAEARRTLVEDIAATHEHDQFWRVSRCLIDALAMMRATEPDMAARIANRIPDQRVRAKAARVLQERGPCAPRTYFRAGPLDQA